MTGAVILSRWPRSTPSTSSIRIRPSTKLSKKASRSRKTSPVWRCKDFSPDRKPETSNPRWLILLIGRNRWNQLIWVFKWILSTNLWIKSRKTRRSKKTSSLARDMPLRCQLWKLSPSLRPSFQVSRAHYPHSRSLKMPIRYKELLVRCRNPPTRRFLFSWQVQAKLVVLQVQWTQEIRLSQCHLVPPKWAQEHQTNFCSCQVLPRRTSPCQLSSTLRQPHP